MHEVASSPALNFSPFLSQLAARHPDWLEDLQASGRLACTSTPSAELLQAEVREVGLDAALRRFRNREMMRIIWRDLNRQASLKETLSDLSMLADICLEIATSHHTTTLEAHHGKPCSADGAPQKLVVIGLGKLGGNELNMSSDIDIIFCFPDRGVCGGSGGLANEQFFTRLVRKIIHSLSQVTADGFCFRVDTRLRPFGASGPLVSSFAALEQYYQREGRDWERYALIKARPVAGDLAAGRQLLGILKPFVYRRYIDFGAIEALHDMHQSVRENARRRDHTEDIKRGPGGIREIEFLVQTFQLLRGGRETALQTPSIFTALDQLQRLNLLPESTVSGLLAAYHFLRNVENRVQALHDQQTHIVPAGEDGMRVARSMGFETKTGFQAALDETRDSVQSLFEQSLPQPTGLDDEKNPWHIFWQQARDSTRDGNAGAAGGKPTQWQPLTAFIKRLNRLSLSQRASRRLDRFMPLLLERIDSFSTPDEVVNRVFDLLSVICRRSAYLSLLLQNPQATDRMLELFAASKRVATAVTRHPALLDELIDPSLGACPPTSKDIQAGVKQVLKNPGNTEATLQNLNYYKQAVSLRIAVAALQSTMTVFEVQAALSQLAETLIGAALTLSQAEMEARHGRLPGMELAVIAYGSLGACNLGFDSDLDLIFLYHPESKRSQGARPIHAERYHTGVARRLLSLLSATTPSGRLYNIDARLRPNGRAGLLVSSVSAFSRYQLEKAWVWELQALTRARPIAGSAAVRQDFSAARQRALTLARNPQQISHEVRAMRQRVAQQHRGGDPLKHGPGGLLDIEFVVQLGLLLNIERFPQLLDSTQLREQLRLLHACNWLDAQAFKTLNGAHTQLSRIHQETALLDDSIKVDTDVQLEAAKTLCDEILR